MEGRVRDRDRNRNMGGFLLKPQHLEYRIAGSKKIVS
jgi:hypothetical protein